jgi:hypothetical protein
MTRTALILTLAIALTGCADVATNVAINVAGPILVVPAVELAGTGLQAAGEAVADGYEYTAEQIEALHKFLGDEGFYELFGGPGAKGNVQ